MKILKIRETDLLQLHHRHRIPFSPASISNALQGEDENSPRGIGGEGQTLSTQIHELNNNIDRTYSLLASSTDNLTKLSDDVALKTMKKVYYSIIIDFQ